MLVFPSIPSHSIELRGNHLILLRKHYLTSQHFYILLECTRSKRPKYLNGYLFNVLKEDFYLLHLYYSSVYQLTDKATFGLQMSK